MKIYHILTLRVDTEKNLQTHEDIHQQILLAKFHENLILPGGVDPILGERIKNVANQIFMKLCKIDLLVNILKCMDSFFDIYCQI